MVALRLGLVLARSSQVHRGGFLRLIQPEPNALQISDEAKWQAISEELAKRRSHASQVKRRKMPGRRASLVQLLRERGRTGIMKSVPAVSRSLLSLTVRDAPISNEKGNHEMVMEDW